jgi:methyltransferase family protein
VARSRIPDADLRTGEIQALPYDDASFDVVTAFNSIQYAADPAVRQVMHDVLEADRKPDGQLRQDNVFRYVLAVK